jgi:DNA polymerase-3 subunit epsilon
VRRFNQLTRGKNSLFRITDKYNLCQKYTGLYQTKAACFQYKIKECDGLHGIATKIQFKSSSVHN